MNDDICYCTALRDAAAFSTDLYDAALRPLGIKVTMFRLLRRIDAAEGASISDLASQIGLDRSTLGRNLRVLERQGLIESGISDDQRARRIVLTGTGREKLEAAAPLWEAVQNDFAEKIGPQALELLAEMGDLRKSQRKTTEDYA